MSNPWEYGTYIGSAPRDSQRILLIFACFFVEVYEKFECLDKSNMVATLLVFLFDRGVSAADVEIVST